MASTVAVVNREFFDLVKAIGESKSKQEEDRIVAEELLYLKKTINQTNTTKKKMKELVVRSIYVEMLGQDASFAYIRAVELCASTSISQKRAGYLAASLFLSPTHEFRFMLVNQIQRDMKSTNLLEINAALTAVCKLVTEDMIPAVIGEVLNLLTHDMELVRKKAVLVLHRFYQMDKKSVLDHGEKIRRALCDKDPCVMAATLPLFQALITDDVQTYKDLVPSFVSILQQITEHRLPRDYDYHRIPAPWVQMHLIRILALLGRGDQVASEGMYEVLVETMRRADSGINVGYAIVYECIKAVIMIYPNNVLMDAAATSISRFIRSDSHNLKYIGIKGLASIVKDHPRYAADHQMAVIDCLEDPDETLKRKTLELLYRMTNAVNVEFIVDKLLSFLETSLDDHFRSDLVNQISQCAERFAPSNSWYVQTIVRVFELAGDKVKVGVAQTLTVLIAEGAEEEDDDELNAEEKDDALRTQAVEHFLALLDKPKLPAILVQTVAWTLGEYGYLSTSCSKEVIMDKLSSLIYLSSEPESKGMLITALAKLIAQNGSCPSRVLQTISFFAESKYLDVQQRCIEVLAMLKHSSVMVDALPVDASCEDIDIDQDLSFLNDFVQVALQQGARPYSFPASLLDDANGEGSNKKTELNVVPYAVPKLPPANSVGIVNTVSSVEAARVPTGPTPLGPAITNQQPPALSIATAQGNQLIGTRGAAQVWGKKPEPPPPPVSTPPQQTHQSQVMQSSAASTSNVGGNDLTLRSTSGTWGHGGSLSNDSAPSPAVPATPPLPKVLSEKEKMAAALFGGVGSISTGAKKRTSTASLASPHPSPAFSSPAGPTHASPEEPPHPSPVQTMDLLSLGDHSKKPSTPTSTTVPTTNGSHSTSVSIDQFELGLHSGAPSSSIMPVTPTATSSSSNNVANLLFGDMRVSTSVSMDPGMSQTAPILQTTTPTKSDLISDVFGNLDLSSAGSNLISMSSEPTLSLHPFTISTPEFGKRWGTTRIESKQTVSCMHWSRLDLETLRRAMPPVYHHVESIPSTMEAIFAATVTSLGAIILVHAKINTNRKMCDITVKANTQDLAGKEASTLSTALTAFRG